VADTAIRKNKIDIMDFEFEDMNDSGDNDILLRMEHEDGTHITFLTAHPSVFTNQDVLEKLIHESVEKNGETYGNHASAFLPLSLIINTGIKAVDEYMNKRKDK